MRPPFLTALLFVLAATALITVTPSGAVAQERDEAGEAAVLERLNVLRSEAGLSPLSRDARLDAAARTHSADMAWHQMLEHVSPRTGSPADRVEATGLEVGALAENVAFEGSSAEAQAGLEASPAHAQNMLASSMTHVGISAVYADGGVYVTEVFASIAGAPQQEAGSAAPAVRAPVVAPAPQQEGATDGGPRRQRDAVVPSRQAAVSSAGSAAPQPEGEAPAAASPLAVTQPGQRRVAGYWVRHAGRWFYYPMPPNAQPGQRLVPDLSVTGGPPGHAQPSPVRSAPVVHGGARGVTYTYPAPRPAGASPRGGATVHVIAPGTTTVRRAPPPVYRYRF
ncbi:MAG: hypothetical protein DRJ42_17050 [Deltaproteobacteria bacterium]|nr:MAG: hypothetical protein DRJ42_17050 [Deltaproteobacteria bacterium]